MLLREPRDTSRTSTPDLQAQDLLLTERGGKNTQGSDQLAATDLPTGILLLLHALQFEEFGVTCFF